MKHPKLRKELFIAIIFSSFYILLSIFNYHLDKFLPGVRIDILRYIVFGIILILFIGQVINIIRRRKKSRGRIKLRPVFYLPAVVLLLAMLYSLAPKKLNSENLQSKIVLRGCYEQAEQHAILFLRSRGTFDLKWQSDELVEWYSGSYTQSKDSLYLLYHDKKPLRVGAIIVNTGTYLVSVDKPAPKEGHVQLRIGECQEK